MKNVADINLVDVCKFAGNLAFSVDNAITLVTALWHGHEVAEKVQFNVLRSHQEHMFIEGLKKLGLDTESSDTVRCAKFHALSNHLGGLRVRYAFEGQKAWLVYDSPYWMDSPWMPGVSVAAIRPELLLRTMEAWHANNGVLLDNPSLAFVITSLVPRGDACDAGYFIDTGRTLQPEERLQVRFDEVMPKNLMFESPHLDEKVWPLERQAKAWRNFSVNYVGGRIFWLIELLGLTDAARIVEHAFRLVLLQYRERVSQFFELDSSPSPNRAAAFWASWHRSWGDEVELRSSENGNVSGIVRRSRIHEVGEFAAPSAPFPTQIEAAIGRAWKSLIEYDCPGVSLTMNNCLADTKPQWTFNFTKETV